jgi:RNAse (barnase) inhibitor barstar
MAQAQLDGAAIKDWDSFHAQCADRFGFPAFYGRNMDAWIDCLTYVRDGDGMSRFALGETESLVIEVQNTEAFNRQSPEIFDSFVECVAIVNQRHATAGEIPALQVLFR